MSYTRLLVHHNQLQEGNPTPQGTPSKLHPIGAWVWSRALPATPRWLDSRVQYTEAPPPSLPPARPSEALERTLAQNPHIIQRRLGTAPSARDIDPFVTQSNWLTRTSGWTTATVQGMKDRMVATPRLREECIALLGHLRQSIRHDDYTLLALLQTHDPSVSSDCSSIVTLTLTLFPLGANPRPHHSPSSRSPQM